MIQSGIGTTVPHGWEAGNNFLCRDQIEMDSGLINPNSFSRVRLCRTADRRVDFRLPLCLCVDQIESRELT